MQSLKKVEEDVLSFWDKNKIYKKTKTKLKNKPKFYFVDGPPYTTGAIHVGHAWNKTLKDVFLRYKRMSGYNIWDQPGFDMHGLPIEVKVEKKLGLKNKEELIRKIGLKKFIEECEKFAIDNMHPMIKDFSRVGVWMDWDNPYMTIKNKYIEGTWWALKEAYKNDYLYKGKKVMTWCPRCATALAKHELDYKTVRDNSIFLKFQLENKEYLIIWTTTPWTIPFNMAVMVNPELEYVKAKVDNEIWIVAKALAAPLIQAVAGKSFTVIDEFKGDKLEGLKYIHPLSEEIKYPEAKNRHTVILSKEYVDTSAGSGLVHCAPGCGPEDYEMGKKYGLPPFNNLDEQGIFPQEMGKFKGLQAKKDDAKFTEALKDVLIAETEVEHEYAHCWRCESPVIFKTTDQWFLAVEKVKEKMRKLNKKICWVPDWAGSKWFDSWLDNLQDWCISRQRFWGIPLPIWVCNDCNKFEVIGTIDELKKKAKKVPQNLHRPWIDEVTIKCKCGSEMKRVEDVLDVWMDSGAAPWATLNYPSEKKLFKQLWPMDFILEGKDQIRGWFNSLICLSMVSFKEPSYKAVYMHGMILDAQGRKMSKSLGNIISPYEVIEKWGADTMRYYMVGGAEAGLDLNYNFEDMKVKHRNLTILLNLSRYLINYAKDAKVNPVKLKESKFSIEEEYMLSKLNSAIKQTTDLLNEYKLNKTPKIIEDLFLELSRTYIQLTRDKAAIGTAKEKKVVLYTVYNTLISSLKLFAPICPFTTEAIYQNLRKEFKLKEESIHLSDWPKYNAKKINKKLEEDIETIKGIIQEILSQREKAQLGVRWPLKEVTITTEKTASIKKLKHIIQLQTNIKNIKIKKGKSLIALNTTLTPELEAEGFSRELTRRIQNLRKKAGLQKSDNIELLIDSSYDLTKWKKEIQNRVGAKSLEFSVPKKEYSSKSEETIKNKVFNIYFRKI